MGGDPALESQSAQGHVYDPRREITLPLGFHGDRLLLKKVQDHGDVVRREAPQYVLLGANQTHVEPIGVAVEHAAELAFVDELAEPDDGRMVKQDVPDHEDQRSIFGQSYQGLAFVCEQGQRLFDVDVFVGFKTFSRDLAMSCGRRCDGHRVDFRILEYVLQFLREYHGRVSQAE